MAEQSGAMDGGVGVNHTTVVPANAETADSEPDATRKLKMYVPTEKDDGETAREIRRQLIAEFGGATQYETVGSWESPEGDVVTEDVTVVESVGDISEEFAKKVARRVKVALDETAVMYELTETAATFV